MTRPTVAIVGLGLVGGSLARALTRGRYRVVGVDRPQVTRHALAARAIAAVAPSPEAAARDADILVLAAPPRVNLRILRRLAGASRAALVITDVSSVKGPICREAERLGLDGFVGGHPMAGTTAAGFGASSADLFRRRPWILTSRAGAPLRRVRALVRAVGGRPARMTPRDHDRAVAFLSHLPQVVSWALMDAARGDRVTRSALALAGPGFQDMTRLARSPRALWREILGENRGEVARALEAFRRRLSR